MRPFSLILVVAILVATFLPEALPSPLQLINGCEQHSTCFDCSSSSLGCCWVPPDKKGQQGVCVETDTSVRGCPSGSFQSCSGECATYTDCDSCASEVNSDPCCWSESKGVCTEAQYVSTSTSPVCTTDSSLTCPSPPTCDANTDCSSCTSPEINCCWNSSENTCDSSVGRECTGAFSSVCDGVMSCGVYKTCNDCKSFDSSLDCCWSREKGECVEAVVKKGCPSGYGDECSCEDHVSCASCLTLDDNSGTSTRTVDIYVPPAPLSLEKSAECCWYKDKGVCVEKANGKCSSPATDEGCSLQEAPTPCEERVGCAECNDDSTCCYIDSKCRLNDGDGECGADAVTQCVVPCVDRSTCSQCADTSRETGTDLHNDCCWDHSSQVCVPPKVAGDVSVCPARDFMFSTPLDCKAILDVCTAPTSLTCDGVGTWVIKKFTGTINPPSLSPVPSTPSPSSTPPVAPGKAIVVGTIDLDRDLTLRPSQSLEITGDIVVNSTTVFLEENSSVTVLENITFGTSSTLNVAPNATITVGGCVHFDGDLVIIPPPGFVGVLEVLKYECHRGEFNNIHTSNLPDSCTPPLSSYTQHVFTLTFPVCESEVSQNSAAVLIGGGRGGGGEVLLVFIAITFLMIV